MIISLQIRIMPDKGIYFELQLRTGTTLLSTAAYNTMRFKISS